MEKPLVAIRTVVYNHAPYLRDYFNGIIMQQTKFPFWAIVHDDCSTDGSTMIIEEYAQKYPDIIKPIYEKENQWSKHDNSIRRIINKAIEETGAKYIAICEGDDYWTDPYKLQKQIDFLENHPDFGACCTRYRFYYQKTDEFSESDHYDGVLHEGLNGLEMNHDNYFAIGVMPQALTMVYRANLFPSDAYYYKLKIQQDNALFYCMTLYGKIWLMNRVTGVYRRHANGLSSVVKRQGPIAHTQVLHDIFIDCWKYDKSESLREVVLKYTQALCTSSIRYTSPLDMNLIQRCVKEYTEIASLKERIYLYKRILRAIVVRMIKRPYINIVSER